MILVPLKAAESSDSLVIKANPVKRTSSGLCLVVLSHASDFPDSLGFVDEIKSEEDRIMILMPLNAAESSDSLVIKANPAKRTSSGLCLVELSRASDFPDSLGFVDEIKSEEGWHHDFVGVEGCRIGRFAWNQSESKNRDRHMVLEWIPNGKSGFRRF